MPEVDARDAAAAAAAFARHRAGFRPLVLRGLNADWPAVAAGAGGATALASYLRGFDNGRPADVFFAPSAEKGRYAYQPQLAGFNFERRSLAIGDLLGALSQLPEADPPYSLYMGSAPTPDHLPGFAEAHRNPLTPAAPPRIWIGNASRVATHYDLSENLACVVAGRRRFTLFPPDQVANLYVGPLDYTVAGQPTSLVDPDEPDLGRFPRFADALGAAMSADLAPGDAIYIPPLWWHAVTAAGALNVLVNYWWDEAGADAGSPFDAMAHAIWALGALPRAQRQAWRAFFDYYAFRTGPDPAEHLPEARRGVLGASTPGLRQRFRAYLLHALGGRPN